MAATTPASSQLPQVPEDTALSGSQPLDINSSNNTLQFATTDDILETGRQKRQRNRRTKQWSDGVIGMVHPSPEFHAELSQLKAQQVRPLATGGHQPERRGSQVNFAIPTPGDVEAHMEQEHGHDSWRFQVVNFLHQKRIQYIMMSLLVLDVLILFVEVTLMAVFPHCAIIQRDAISCVPDYYYNYDPINNGSDNHTRFLAGGSDDHDICSAGNNENDNNLSWTPEPDYAVGCDSHKWHTVHTVEEAMFVITMIILSIFFLELNALMVALKPQIFFRQVFYVLDYVIITVSLVLEAFLHAKHHDLSQALVGMLVVLRSWRYVRISHGIIDITVKLTEPDMNRLLAYTESLEQLLEEQGIVVANVVPASQLQKIEALKTEKEPDLMAQVRRHHAQEKQAKRQLRESNKKQHSSTTGGSSSDQDDDENAENGVDGIGTRSNQQKNKTVQRIGKQ